MHLGALRDGGGECRRDEPGHQPRARHARRPLHPPTTATTSTSTSASTSTIPPHPTTTTTATTTATATATAAAAATTAATVAALPRGPGGDRRLDAVQHVLPSLLRLEDPRTQRELRPGLGLRWRHHPARRRLGDRAVVHLLQCHDLQERRRWEERWDER